MKAVKIVAILVVIYAGLVAAFEALIGYSQPTSGSTVVITTFDADGTAHDRVVSRLESGGQAYVAANHWPRAWYRRALANPDVRISLDGKVTDYRAVPVTGEEHDRVEAEHRLRWMSQIRMGFAPRYFLRLDPRES